MLSILYLGMIISENWLEHYCHYPSICSSELFADHNCTLYNSHHIPKSMQNPNPFANKASLAKMIHVGLYIYAPTHLNIVSLWVWACRPRLRDCGEDLQNWNCGASLGGCLLPLLQVRNALASGKVIRNSAKFFSCAIHVQCLCCIFVREKRNRASVARQFPPSVQVWSLLSACNN